MSYKWLSILGLGLVIVLAGCATTDSTGDVAVGQAAVKGAAAVETKPIDLTPHEKEGFALRRIYGGLGVALGRRLQSNSLK